MSKMTDEQIVKALKHCYEHKSCNDCVGCLGEEECILNVDPAGDIYPVINRQQAEIERLNGCVKSEEEVRAIANATIQAGIRIIKAEAIKEFADRLKEHLKGYGGLYCVTTMNAHIDNLVKEMVGEGK